MQKKRFFRSLQCLLIITAFVMQVSCFKVSEDSNTDNNGTPNPNDNDTATDYASDATDAGYDVPNVTLQGVSDFVLSGDYDTLTDISGDTSAETDSGVVNLDVTLDDSVTGNITVWVWVNGETSLIAEDLAGGDWVEAEVILSNGSNFICVLVYVNGVLWGRSEVVWIESATPASLARIELTWNGSGDVDLHLDNTAQGIHVYYANDIYNSGGFNVELDVDNTSGYGPENIRVYDVPSSTQFRVFVNYFSGSSNLTATLKVFNAANDLINTYTHNFTASDSGAGSDFNAKSWTVGSLTVTP